MKVTNHKIPHYAAFRTVNVSVG